MSMRLFPVTVALLLVCVVFARAQLDADVSDAQLVQRYCVGMPIKQRQLPDGTEADCISDTHAIEVEKAKFSWDSIGQSLNYALWTREISENPAAFKPWSEEIDKPRKAGIILVCTRPRDPSNPNDFCTLWYTRLFRIIEENHLAITIWDCNYPADAALGDCLMIDMPPAVTQKLE